MGGRPKRGCTSDSSNDANGVPAQKFFIEGPSAPATKEDKCRWKGFCEIESEPVCASTECMILLTKVRFTNGLGIFQCDAQAFRGERCQSQRGRFTR